MLRQDKKLLESLRKDLLKKLNFTIIEIPSLSHRKNDIGELIEIFASEIFIKKGLKIKKFSLKLFHI